MLTIPFQHGLILAGILFSIGAMSLIIRRNIFFILLSIEIMLNAAGLAFVVAGAHWGQAEGQIMFIFIWRSNYSIYFMRTSHFTTKKYNRSAIGISKSIKKFAVVNICILNVFHLFILSR